MTPTGPSAGSNPHAGDTAAQAARRALPAHFREKSPLTDTAGVPWQGRDYAVSPFPDDDGSAPAALVAALELAGTDRDPHRQLLVEALAASRLLVPIMAVATETGTTAHGLTGDNGADMAMVSITAPDGSRILPVFSSVAALAAWQATARPVPVIAAQAAQAAVQEGCTSLLLDPGTAGDGGRGVGFPRSVLWAIAQGRTWIPPHEDPQLRAVLDAIAREVPAALALTPTAGTAREVDMHLRLEPGLTRERLQEVVADVTARLGAEPLVGERITSLRLVLES